MRTLITRKDFKTQIIDNLKIPKGDCLYFIYIDNHTSGRMFKVGTSNRFVTRMYEHMGAYQSNITVLWVSNTYSKYTTLRVEDKTKDNLKSLGYEYHKNDRFVIPKEVTQISIEVKKKFIINLEYN